MSVRVKENGITRDVSVNDLLGSEFECSSDEESDYDPEQVRDPSRLFSQIITNEENNDVDVDPDSELNTLLALVGNEMAATELPTLDVEQEVNAGENSAGTSTIVTPSFSSSDVVSIPKLSAISSPAKIRTNLNLEALSPVAVSSSNSTSTPKLSATSSRTKIRRKVNLDTPSPVTVSSSNFASTSGLSANLSPIKTRKKRNLKTPSLIRMPPNQKLFTTPPLNLSTPVPVPSTSKTLFPSASLSNSAPTKLQRVRKNTKKRKTEAEKLKGVLKWKKNTKIL